MKIFPTCSTMRFGYRNALACFIGKKPKDINRCSGTIDKNISTILEKLQEGYK